MRVARFFSSWARGSEDLSIERDTNLSFARARLSWRSLARRAIEYHRYNFFRPASNVTRLFSLRVIHLTVLL